MPSIVMNVVVYRGVEQLAARRAHNPKVVGSNPAPATMLSRGETSCLLHLFNNAGVAQLVERILGKDKVTGSIPVTSSIGGVAQLARACGSYPQCPGFESLRRHQ